MTIYTEDIAVNFFEVRSLLPTSVPDADVESAISAAGSFIETISGVLLLAADRTDSGTSVSTRDAVWLRKAISFQAAWLIDQVDVAGRQAVSSLSQDGLSMSAMDGLTFVLAPMAKRALNNCSWAKTGTLRVESPSDELAETPLVSDNHPWYPLGAA